jgi:hypothetical protein
VAADQGFRAFPLDMVICIDYPRVADVGIDYGSLGHVLGNVGMHILVWLFRFREKVHVNFPILLGQELGTGAGVHVRQLYKAALTSLSHSKIQFG